jgi:hypothetical protein
MSNLPFGSGLPRWVGHLLTSGRRPRGYLHSYPKLLRLLSAAGFKDIKGCWATPDMRWSTNYIPLDADLSRVRYTEQASAGNEDGSHALVKIRGPQINISCEKASLWRVSYTFDLWAERWRRREATGDMILMRYADDSVPRTHRSKEVRSCVRDGGPEPAVRAGFKPPQAASVKSRGGDANVCQRYAVVADEIDQRTVTAVQRRDTLGRFAA